MKKTIIIVSIIIASLQLSAQEFSQLHFGTDSTLDVVSWNIEWFPKNGQTTINNVVAIIKAMDADVIAVQEIDNKSSLQQVINNLEDYSGYYLNGDYNSLAYIYKTAEVSVNETYEIFDTEWRVFPRSPLVFEFTFRNEDYTVINNHFKCCGDGVIDPYDDWDEERRRNDACIMIHEYIEEQMPDERVIVLGDLNDILDDDPYNNVFNIFINDESHYLFADMEIALSNSSEWSYPNWPSHLDHILITNELFQTYEHANSSCEIIKLDEHFYGGYNEYDNLVTDHRPVGLKLFAPNETGIDDIRSNPNYYCSPNPFTQSSTFYFSGPHSQMQISILNSQGKLIEEIKINRGEKSIKWDASQYSAGLYFVLFKDGNITENIQKILIQ